MLDAPVLLSKNESLPDVVAQEIASLAPRRIVVLGGEDVLSSEVAEQAADAAGNGCSIAASIATSRSSLRASSSTSESTRRRKTACPAGASSPSSHTTTAWAT